MSLDVRKIAEKVMRENGYDYLPQDNGEVSIERNAPRRRNEGLLQALLTIMEKLDDMSDETFLLFYMELTREFERRFSVDIHPTLENIAVSLLAVVSGEV